MRHRHRLCISVSKSGWIEDVLPGIRLPPRRFAGRVFGFGLRDIGIAGEWFYRRPGKN